MRGRKPSTPETPRPLPNSGDEIEVYWAGDRRYYPGKIGNFDSNTNTFRVEYVDGDVENLDLNTERWRRRDENPNFQRIQEGRHASERSNTVPVAAGKSKFKQSPAKSSPAKQLTPRSNATSSGKSSLPTNSESKRENTPAEHRPSSGKSSTSAMKPVIPTSSAPPIAPATSSRMRQSPARPTSVSPSNAAPIMPKPAAKPSPPMTNPVRMTGDVSVPIAKSANPAQPSQETVPVPSTTGPRVTPTPVAHTQPKPPTSVVSGGAAPRTSTSSAPISKSASTPSRVATQSKISFIPGPPPPPILPSDPPGFSTARRPQQTLTTTPATKKRKQSADVNGDVRMSTPTATGNGATTTPSGPTMNSGTAMPRNNGSNTAPSTTPPRPSFVPPIPKRVRPVSAPDNGIGKRIRKGPGRAGGDQQASVKLMAQLAADAARTTYLRDSAPMSKEMETMRETMDKWGKDHANVASTLTGFAKNLERVVDSNANTVQFTTNAAQRDGEMEKRLSKYFAHHTDLSAQVIARMSSLEAAITESNRLHASAIAMGSVPAAPKTGVDPELNRRVLEQMGLITTLIRNEMKNIANAARSTQNVEMDKMLEQKCELIVERTLIPQMKGIATEVYAAQAQNARPSEPAMGSTGPHRRQQQAPSIVRMLVGRSATIWLLEDTKRSPPPDVKADIPKWTSDCCTSCFKGVLEKLSEFQSAESAVRILTAHLNGDVRLGWFFEPGVEMNVQQARPNYSSWDPPLTNNEWEAEAGVLRELARRFAVAENNAQTNQGSELENAISITQVAVDTN